MRPSFSRPPMPFLGLLAMVGTLLAEGLCREAAMGPCRDPGFESQLLAGLDVAAVRPVTTADFEDALCQVRASVSPGDLKAFDEWNKQFGSFQNAEAKAAA